jgi:histidyl-tRNA synthetase
MGNKKVGKAMDRANKEGVRQVIIIGEEEVRNNQFKIKDMSTGDEEIVNFIFQDQ